MTDTAAAVKVGLWNVRQGRDWRKEVRPSLQKALDKTHPDVQFVLEAYDTPWPLYDKIDGYRRVYHATGYPDRYAGRVDEHSAIAVLIRDGVEILDREPWEMKRPWTGPHGVKHHPRIHRELDVRIDGVEFDLLGMHHPFGLLARRESNRAAINFLKEPGHRIVVADWNQRRDLVAARVAKPAGAAINGAGIDLAVYSRTLRCVKGENLSYLGSDHQFKTWTFVTR